MVSVVIASLLGLPLPALAQIVVDDTLGAEASTLQMLDAFTQEIEGGATRGTNLFHSFLEFNVADGQSVYFNPDGAIENVLSRVTGENASNIFGTLGVRTGANLWFANPHGIVFGENASLDISGSFYATTATAIPLGDAGAFSAVNPAETSLLTVSPSASFLNYLTADSRDIGSSADLSAGQNLTLSALNLDLQGQLQAGENLTLQAADTATISDTAADAFTAIAGNGLTIQGNQGIDIWTLQHLEDIPFVSGGDLTLISDGIISADAHFASAGNLQFLTSAGTPGTVVSFYDPIISAAGDVVFGDYTGASLKVEATGSIDGGNIRITGPDTTFTPDGSGSDTDLLASGRAVILRAGLDSVGDSNIPQTPENTPFNPGTITGSPGSITVGNINVSDTTGGDGGTIILSATGDITVNGDDGLNAQAFSSAGAAGNGGSIDLLSASGNILIRSNVDSRSRPFTLINSDVGNGGDVSISSTSGDIVIDGRVYSSTLSENGNAGGGGDVSISSTSGDITIGNVNAASSSNGLDSGDGGAITITTTSGDITTGLLRAQSFSRSGTAGDGGSIALSTTSGNIETNGDLFSSSSALEGDAGSGADIIISSTSGDIDIKGRFQARSYITYDRDDDIDGDGIAGDGGNITVSNASGNITVSGEVNASSFSPLGTAQNGGRVSISATSGDVILEGNVNASSAGKNGIAGRGGDIFISGLSVSGQGNLNTASFSEIGVSGDGGNIEVIATLGDIQTTGNLNASSFAEDGDAGEGGDIALTAESGSIIGDDSLANTIAIAQGSVLDKSGGNVALRANSVSGFDVLTLSSTGASGDVQIQSVEADLLVRDVSLITSGQVVVENPFFPFFGAATVTLELPEIGQSGNTTITSVGDILLNNVEIQSDANGSTPAGNVTITSPGQLTFNNSLISSNANNAGDAGFITLNVARLNLGNGGRILAETSGAGNGGDIVINATDSVTLGEGVQDFEPIISVEASGSGQPGNIAINTPTFVLSETARITATARETASNLEEGGSIILSANVMDLQGTVGIFAETQGDAPGGVLTLQPYQDNPDLTLTLAPNALISASTSGAGIGGGLVVRAPESIAISGPGRLAVETSGPGPAGNIELISPRLTLSDGVTLSATTTGAGTAGNVTVNASDRVEIDASTITSSTGVGSTGTGGNISLNTAEAVLRNGGRIRVDSAGGGQGGDVVVTAENLTLDNSEITADTQSSDGGNLTLRINEFLTLQNGSLISAEAGTAQAGGNGGSITINSDFVIAFAEENNDIIANAFNGDGGRIDITAFGIFGLTERRGLSRQQLRENRSNDISASSQFGPQGIIRLSTIIADPTQTLESLSEEFINPDDLILNSCITRSSLQAQGSFVIAELSGLPQQPGNPLPVTFATEEVRAISEDTYTDPTARSWQRGETLAEPDGVYQLADGRLVLSHQCDADPTYGRRQSG